MGKKVYCEKSDNSKKLSEFLTVEWKQQAKIFSLLSLKTNKSIKSSQLRGFN